MARMVVFGHPMMLGDLWGARQDDLFRQRRSNAEKDPLISFVCGGGSQKTNRTEQNRTEQNSGGCDKNTR